MYRDGASISHRERSIYMHLECIRMVLQYLTGYEDHYRCVKGVFARCFNISQGKKIILDACMVYFHGASISHRVKRSLETCLGYIRMVLKYLTG